MKTLISTNVSKLGESLPCFNLPVLKTCPGRTIACSRYCYARRHHYCMAGIKNKLEWNYKQSKMPDFVNRINWELQGYRFLIKSKGGILNRFRLHSSGDFYSQSYLDAWKKIARRNPDIKFVTYTRSYMLNFNSLPSNLTIYYTVDECTTKIAEKLKRKAIVIKKHDIPLYKNSSNIICSSKCYKCNACWNSKLSNKNVVFIKH